MKGNIKIMLGYNEINHKEKLGDLLREGLALYLQ